MKSIAFLGDSITYGFGLSEQNLRYSTLTSQELGLEEENYGITGTLVAKAGLNISDGNDFVSRMGLIDSADVAVIFGGTNDYFWSDRGISGENDDSYFECAVRTMCKRVCEARKGKITLFVTPYAHNGIGNYLGGEAWNSSSRHDTSEVNFNGHTLSEYSYVIEKVCGEYGLPCLNLHRDFDFDWRVHTLDGCHPNEEGHRILSEAITEKLNVLIRKR